MSTPVLIRVKEAVVTGRALRYGGRVHALWLISVWLHILAATAWLGGMLFLVLVVVPWLRSGDRANAAALLGETGVRFRSVGWSCFLILVCTGAFNLWMRGVRLDSFLDAGWRATGFGQAVMLKLLLFTAVASLSAVHDFSIGPRAVSALAADPKSAEAGRLRRLASHFGRINVLLALALVALGVVLVRG